MYYACKENYRTDYIEANRKACREVKIVNLSHPISLSRVHTSKRFTTIDTRRQMIKGIYLHFFI